MKAVELGTNITPRNSLPLEGNYLLEDVEEEEHLQEAEEEDDEGEHERTPLALAVNTELK